MRFRYKFIIIGGVDNERNQRLDMILWYFWLMSERKVEENMY